MYKTLSILLMMGSLLLVNVNSSYAQTTDPSATATVGEKLKIFADQVKDTLQADASASGLTSIKPENMLGVGFTMVGLLLMARGIMRLRQSSTDPQATSQGIALLFFGTVIGSLPEFMGTGILTLFGELKTTTGVPTPGQVTNCMSASSLGAGSACIAGNIAANVIPILVYLVMSLITITGLLLAFNTLMSMKRAAEGGQPLPEGWFFELLMAVVMVNIWQALSLIEATLGFGSGAISTYAGNLSGIANDVSLIGYPSGGTDEFMEAFKTGVSKCMVIFFGFGVCVIKKGLDRMRDKEKPAFREGCVYFIAGIGLCNLHLLINLVAMSTMGTTPS